MAYSLISIVSISAVSLQLYILTTRWNRILTRSPDSPHNPGSIFRVQNQICIWEGCPQSTGLNGYSIRGHFWGRECLTNDTKHHLGNQITRSGNKEHSLADIPH